MAIRYVDLENGNDANDGSTFALRKKSIASASTGLTSVDTIRVMASPDPVATGINATFTNQNDTITLASAMTLNIDDGVTAWTGAANVTATSSTVTYQEGPRSAQFDVAVGFTTGLIGHRTLTALDLSAYQQVSFYFRCSTTLAASALELRLCSDTAGLTAVETYVFPAITANAWVPLVYNKNAALSSTVQSIALYAATDPGSNTLNIDNVIACKAATAPDCLTHKKLIGKNLPIATEPFLAIDSINGTTIKLGRSRMLTASGNRATFAGFYGGTTATQELYTVDPIEITATQTVSTPCAVSCGWNRTDMSTQTGLSYVRHTAPGSNTFSVGSAATISRFCPVQCGVTSSGGGLTLTTSYVTLRELWIVACYTGILLSSSTGCDIDIYGVAMNSNAISTVGGTTNNNWNVPTKIKLGKAWGDGAIGISSAQSALCLLGHSNIGYSFILDVPEVRNFGTATYFIASSIYSRLACKNILSITNCGAGISCTLAGIIPPIEMYNCVVADGTGEASATIYSKKHNGVLNDDRIIEYTTGTNVNAILKATDQRHTESGYSWKYLPGAGANNSVPFSPLVLPLGLIPCPADEPRTVKLWVRRSNTATSIRLMARGGFIGGVTADVYADTAAAVNTWVQETITFTPTEQGAVPIEVHFGGPNAAWVDDLEVT